MFQVSVGAVIKAWREARGLSVTELAARAGRPITKGYLSQLEHDKIRRPGDEHLMRLAHALDIPAMYLLTRQLPDVTSLSPILPEAAAEAAAAAADQEEELLRRMLNLVEELRTAIIELLAQQRRT